MSLLKRDPNPPQAWHDSLPVTSRYTAGIAGERFFRSIMEEEVILGSVCEHCAITYVPARQFCERCFHELEDWIDVGTSGEVYTFTLLFENLDGTPLGEPEVIAFIKIEDGGFVHKLDELDLDKLEIGLPVVAVFKDEKEREGSILDIAYFKPVE